MKCSDIASNSLPFTVPVATITSVSPASRPAGAAVTISGSNFNVGRDFSERNATIVLLVLGFGADCWKLHHGDAGAVGGLAQTTTRPLAGNSLHVVRDRRLDPLGRTRAIRVQRWYRDWTSAHPV